MLYHVSYLLSYVVVHCIMCCTSYFVSYPVSYPVSKFEWIDIKGSGKPGLQRCIGGILGTGNDSSKLQDSGNGSILVVWSVWGAVGQKLRVFDVAPPTPIPLHQICQQQWFWVPRMRVFEMQDARNIIAV